MRILTIASFLFLSANAFAGPVYYSTLLLGSNENPSNGSPATGFAEVAIDMVAQTMHVHVVFSDLTGTTTASHIHCCEPTPFGTVNEPVATTTPTFPNFPLGVTSGTYDQTFDLTASSTYNNPSFETAHGGTVASEEAALLTALAADETYLNIHTSTFGGGEIRGILALEAPEPGTFLLAGVCLAGIWLRRRR